MYAQKTHRLLVIPGDGIGPEVIHESLEVLRHLARSFHLQFDLDMQESWNADTFLKFGRCVPEGFIERIPENYDAILFGALGDPRIPDMAHGREILLGLRFKLELYANVRPIRLQDPRLGRLKGVDELDFVVVRENTEDVYVGKGYSKHSGTDQEACVDESQHSYHGVKRIVEYAFEYACRNKRKKVTLSDKSNAIRFGGALWGRVFDDVKQRYPHILADHRYIDSLCTDLILKPHDFDVIVTTNLFGDILSDLGAGLIGGLGYAASANIHPGKIALFEPVHGSAPDIAGKGIANPCAAFLSLAMMMEYLGYVEMSRVLSSAVTDLVRSFEDPRHVISTKAITRALLERL